MMVFIFHALLFITYTYESVFCAHYSVDFDELNKDPYKQKEPASREIPNTRFHILRRGLTWSEAIVACLKKGWKLAVFRSKEETLTTLLQLKAISKPYGHDGKKYEFPVERRYWIGLFDVMIEGEWNWHGGLVDTGTLRESQFLWAPGQPDHYKKDTSTHCVTLWNPNFEDGYRHYFDDDDCTRKYYALCGEAQIRELVQPQHNLSKPIPDPVRGTLGLKPEPAAGNIVKNIPSNSPQSPLVPSFPALSIPIMQSFHALSIPIVPSFPAVSSPYMGPKLPTVYKLIPVSSSPLSSNRTPNPIKKIYVKVMNSQPRLKSGYYNIVSVPQSPPQLTSIIVPPPNIMKLVQIAAPAPTDSQMPSQQYSGLVYTLAPVPASNSLSPYAFTPGEIFVTTDGIIV